MHPHLLHLLFQLGRDGLQLRDLPLHLIYRRLQCVRTLPTMLRCGAADACATSVERVCPWPLACLRYL